MIHITYLLLKYFNFEITHISYTDISIDNGNIENSISNSTGPVNIQKSSTMIERNPLPGTANIHESYTMFNSGSICTTIND